MDMLRNLLFNFFISDKLGGKIRHAISGLGGLVLGLAIGGHTLGDLIDPAVVTNAFNSLGELSATLILALASLYLSKKNKDKNA